MVLRSLPCSFKRRRGFADEGHCARPRLEPAAEVNEGPKRRAHEPKCFQGLAGNSSGRGRGRIQFASSLTTSTKTIAIFIILRELLELASNPAARECYVRLYSNGNVIVVFTFFY